MSEFDFRAMVKSGMSGGSPKYFDSIGSTLFRVCGITTSNPDGICHSESTGMMTIVPALETVSMLAVGSSPVGLSQATAIRTRITVAVSFVIPFTHVTH